MSIYPLNIFTPDPLGNTRPYISFVIREISWKNTTVKDWASSSPNYIVQGGFTLPVPDGGLIDSSSNEFSSETNIISSLAWGAVEQTTGSTIKDGMSQLGIVADPRLTQAYKGTTSRKWSGTWRMIPQSIGESLSVAAILWLIKYSAAPSVSSRDLPLGIMTQPYTLKLVYSNETLQKALKYEEMVIESYSINYFAQGYASTYSDMMPKQIELSLSLAEIGIKTREDWLEAGTMQ